jgi:hypothetical protein
MWFIMAWQHISPAVIVEGFKCCIPNAMDGTDAGTLWNCSEEDGKIRSLCERRGTDCGDETGILIGKGRYNLTHFVHSLYVLIIKYFS